MLAPSRQRDGGRRETEAIMQHGRRTIHPVLHQQWRVGGELLVTHIRAGGCLVCRTLLWFAEVLHVAVGAWEARR